MTDKVEEITFEDMAQMIKGATKIPDVIIEGDEIIIPTEEITRFRWAKINGEWTIVKLPSEEDLEWMKDGDFMVMGSEEPCNPKDFKDFEWGDWIAPPSYAPFPNGIVIDNKEK